MSIENHTIRLLTEMRDRMDQRFEQMDQRFEQMDQRITESQMRLSTEILAVAGALQETKGLVMQQSAIRLVVQDHEQRLLKLEGH